MQGREGGGAVVWLAPNMPLPFTASTLQPVWRCPLALVGVLPFSLAPLPVSPYSRWGWGVPC